MSKPEQRFVFAIDAGQLLCDRRKTELGPFFQLIFVVFSLIFENLVGERI